MDDPKRERIRSALENHFERTGSPRFVLSFIVALTGGVAFLVSFTLLHFGETEMWIRYPVAVIASYIVFLLLLRIWVEFERQRIDPETAQSMVGRQSGTSYRGPSDSDHSWLRILDVTDFGDVGEGCVVGCVLTLVVAVVGGAIITVITSAPALIADVFLDAVLMSLLYKHLKTAAHQHWLGTAIRRTWIAMLITAVSLSVAGVAIQWHWPKAKSFGDMWHTEPRKSM